MTPRLQPLDEPAVDIEQTRLVALDHCISNVWITLARQHPQMACGDLWINGHVDTLRIDTGVTFQNTRIVHGPKRCTGRPSKFTTAISPAPVSTTSNSVVARSGDQLSARRSDLRGIPPARLRTPRQQVRAADRTCGGGRVRAPAPTGRCAEEGALAILHRHRQHHNRPVHVTYSSHRPPCRGGLTTRTSEVRPAGPQHFRRTRFPGASSRKRGGPEFEAAQNSGRARKTRARVHAGLAANPPSVGRYPPGHKAGLMVSRCRRRGRWATDRIATKVRARSPLWCQLFRLNGSAGTGFEPVTDDERSSALPTELPLHDSN
jgi:hypothetical protein